MTSIFGQVIGQTVNEDTKERASENMYLAIGFDYEYTYFDLSYHNWTLYIKCNTDNFSFVEEAMNNATHNYIRNVLDLKLEDCVIDKPLIHVFHNKLKNLTNLTISGNKVNKLTSMTQGKIKKALKNLTQIKGLSLTYLGLQSINELIHEMKKLQKLDLSNNEITTFPCFGKDHRIKTLNMSYNNLTSFHCRRPNCRLNDLTNLDISGNKHINIDPSTFKGCDRLIELHMADTNMKHVDDKLWELNYLDLLNISSNVMERISINNILMNYKSMSESGISMYLSGCSIEDIYDIKSSSNKTYTKSKFKLLDLANNKLKNIDKHLLEILNQTNSVKSIKLGGNPWKCDCDLASFIKFVKHNERKISDVNEVKCLVSGIRISDLDRDALCRKDLLIILGWFIGVTTIGLLILVIGILFRKHRKNNH